MVTLQEDRGVTLQEDRDGPCRRIVMVTLQENRECTLQGGPDDHPAGASLQTFPALGVVDMWSAHPKQIAYTTICGHMLRQGCFVTPRVFLFRRRVILVVAL